VAFADAARFAKASNKARPAEAKPASKPAAAARPARQQSNAATPKKASATGARSANKASDFSRKFALAKEIARSLAAFDHGCLLHDVHISHEGVDTLESLKLILKDFITTHPQTQFFKVDACEDGIMVRLKKGGWVLSQETDQ
jgi:hypothetical protein